MSATETLLANLHAARKQAFAELARIEDVIERFGGSIAYGRSKAGGKRKLSAKARKAIGDAQRKRWAAQRKGAKKAGSKKQVRLPAAPNE